MLRIRLILSRAGLTVVGWRFARRKGVESGRLCLGGLGASPKWWSILAITLRGLGLLLWVTD